MGWLSGWSNRIAMTVNPAGVGVGANVTNAIHKPGVPAALKGVCQGAGQDFRATLADGTTLLDYGIEDWSVAAPVVHIREPDCDEAAHTVYLYGGNAGASDAQNKAGVATDFAGYWPLGDAGPTTAYDWTSNANNGTQSGGVTFGQAGQVDGACTFDGNNDFLNCGSDTSFNFVSACTQMAWIRFASYPTGHHAILRKRRPLDDSDTFMIAYYHGSVTIYAGVRIPPTGPFYSSGEIVTGLALNTWHRIVGVWSRSSQLSRYYRNGSLVSQMASPDVDMGANTADVTIGSLNGFSEFYTGLIDGVAVGGSAVSDDYVRLDANAYPGGGIYTFGALEAAAVAGRRLFTRAFEGLFG